MNESGPKPRSHEAVLLKRWRHVPFIVASQSAYRVSQLESLGLTHVESSGPIPEYIETNTARDFECGDHTPSVYAEDGHDVPRFIAGAKVRHIIDTTNVPADAVVVGFDTAPLLWQTQSNTDEVTFAHLEKPATPEDVKRMVWEIVSTTARGCLERRRRLEAFSAVTNQLPGDDARIVTKNYGRVLRPGTISISSAVAGSFPDNRKKIIGCVDEVSLFSKSIDAMRNDQSGLELLARKLTELMSERATHISGGIDYGDSYVQDLLQLEELKSDFEEGTIAGPAHYSGFPKHAFINLLAIAQPPSST